MQDTARPSGDSYVMTEAGIRLFYRVVGKGPSVVIVPNGIYLLDAFIRLADDERTLIFYDMRNRGQSDPVNDASQLAAGIHNDVDDLEVIRQHFGIGEVDLIGHSYVGLMVVLYAMKHPAHVGRIVQIGAPQPDANKQYPSHLTGDDGMLAEVFAKIAQLKNEWPSDDPVEACRRWWSVFRAIYVVDPADADKIDWGRCHLPNERNLMKYWTGSILPSIQRLTLSAEDFAQVTMPVLTIHGTRDRSAPYGGARDWVSALPNARLVTVENAAHALWIEAPDKVFGSMTTFLNGSWPREAEPPASFGV